MASGTLGPTLRAASGESAQRAYLRRSRGGQTPVAPSRGAASAMKRAVRRDAQRRPLIGLTPGQKRCIAALCEALEHWPLPPHEHAPFGLVAEELNGAVVLSAWPLDEACERFPRFAAGLRDADILRAREGADSAL